MSSFQKKITGHTKRQEKTQSEVPGQLSETDSCKTQILEQKEFQVTTINMLRKLTEKVETMQDWTVIVVKRRKLYEVT